MMMRNVSWPLFVAGRIGRAISLSWTMTRSACGRCPARTFKETLCPALCSAHKFAFRSFVVSPTDPTHGEIGMM